MHKVRMEITKEEEVCFISHLDYARAMERAIRRAKLPAAYSEGFNPHMKLAFASALSVGVTSEGEYMDLELTETVALEDCAARLNQALPRGIRVKRLCYLPERAPSLMSQINRASYRVVLRLPEIEAVQGAAAFQNAATVPYTKLSPKGNRAIDAKTYVPGTLTVQRLSDEECALSFSIRITPTGSMKPVEVVEAAGALAGQGQRWRAAARIHRVGLYVDDAQGQEQSLFGTGEVVEAMPS
ncbi:TIGR03936 family radical SAM-associated protein [Anaeromusa sp.]|jgi:radical SAM-linked protein|uniref:TIGR03936 family radical SAM-associated protein n=1 Tax=Anaeromusa sp. TaxID=1872520 RepID=UPI0029C8C923|nr:TIGR03936 family radical SAM-associated protein [Anaeromusa sp.]MEA4834473.1 TIGR03936 family radical SAM-associated protein [Anaeromusa sp.]NCB76510.1 DUF2344 domain-containing protein [Negativicutes bacterium]